MLCNAVLHEIKSKDGAPGSGMCYCYLHHKYFMIIKMCYCYLHHKYFMIIKMCCCYLHHKYFMIIKMCYCYLHHKYFMIKTQVFLARRIYRTTEERINAVQPSPCSCFRRFWVYAQCAGRVMFFRLSPCPFLGRSSVRTPLYLAV